MVNFGSKNFFIARPNAPAKSSINAPFRAWAILMVAGLSGKVDSVLVKDIAN